MEIYNGELSDGVHTDWIWGRTESWSSGSGLEMQRGSRDKRDSEVGDDGDGVGVSAVREERRRWVGSLREGVWLVHDEGSPDEEEWRQAVVEPLGIQKHSDILWNWTSVPEECEEPDEW